MKRHASPNRIILQKKVKKDDTNKEAKKKVRCIQQENLVVDYNILYCKADSDKIFQQLEKEIHYYKDDLSQIKVFGKCCKIPRQQVAFGDQGVCYRFSGNTLPAKPWSDVPLLLEIKHKLETFLEKKFTFNFVLVNRYNDGNDYIGEHRDNEKELLVEAPIASVSFGQTRDFVFKHRDARGKQKILNNCNIKPVSIPLQSGSLLVMYPPTNTYWYHSLPVRKGIKLPRINLTFRVLQKS